MGIYVFTLTLTFGGFLYYYKRPSFKGYNAIFLMVMFIICFGYMCGSDWREYELVYTSYNENDNFWWRFLYMEPMYLCLNIIGNILGLNFWVFFIIIRLILLYKIIVIIKRFCPKELILLAFTFYLGFWGIMNFIDPSLRNMIAAFIFMCSIDSVINRKFKKFALWVLLATLFHYSSIILLLFYFVLTKSYSNKNIIICFIIANIVLLNPDIIFGFIAKLFSFIPVISAKIENYTTGADSDLGQGKLFSFGYMIHIIFFIMIMCYRKILEKMPNGKLLFNISVLFIFIFRIGLTSLIFSRFQLYISCFYSVVIATSFYFFMQKYRLLYVIGIYFLSIVSNYGQMRNTLFIPYTNYLLYYDSELSYDERSEYNYRYSPYRHQ